MIYVIGFLSFGLLFLFGNYRFWKIQKERDEYMNKIFQAQRDSEAFLNG